MKTRASFPVKRRLEDRSSISCNEAMAVHLKISFVLLGALVLTAPTPAQTGKSWDVSATQAVSLSHDLSGVWMQYPDGDVPGVPGMNAVSNKARPPLTAWGKAKFDAAKPLVQMDELRSGGSYFSQNDLRMHFGLDQAKTVEMVEIRWLSGQVDQLKNLEVNQLYVIQEGGKILKSGPLTQTKTPAPGKG